MTVTRTLALVLAASAVAGAAAGAPARATSTHEAVGGGTTALVITSQRQDGSNLVLEGTSTGVLTGTISGTIEESLRWVIHADGTGVVQLSGTFTGTIGDCGAVTVPNHAVIAGTPASYTGHTVALGPGPGYELFLSGGGGAFTYSGRYHC